MRIGIDISQIVYEGTGVGRFTEGLTQAILRYEKTHDWVFFLSSLRKKPHPNLPNAIRNRGFELIRYPVPPSMLSFVWNDFHRVKIETIMGKVDWFISSDWTEPPSTAKKATIVHDLAFKRYPETVDKTIRSVQEKRLGWVQKESTVIFVDSRSTMEDVRQILNEKTIIINYPGVTVNFKSNEQVNITLKKYNLNRPFILSVGKIEPRKNIKRLIDAYKALKINDIDLVIVGTKGWDTKTQNLYKSDHAIKWLGYVADDDLPALYQSCLFFIFPSLWEGFGYPAVEAMQLGCPTALSNTSSLKEIGEGYSYLFDPMSVGSIKEAMEKMIADENLRQTLKAQGQSHGDSFTWQRYFDTMIQALVNN